MGFNSAFKGLNTLPVLYTYVNVRTYMQPNCKTLHPLS